MSATPSKNPFITAVPVIALVLLLIGWNVGPMLSGGNKTFTSKDFTFDYGPQWTLSDIPKGDHPSNEGPTDKRFAGLSQSDSAITHLVQLDDPHVLVTVRETARPTFAIGLDLRGHNRNVYTGYEQTNFEELKQDGMEAYRLDFTYSTDFGDGKAMPFKGEDRAFLKGDKMVVLSYVAPDETYAKDYAQFEQMVKSLQLK